MVVTLAVQPLFWACGGGEVSHDAGVEQAAVEPTPPAPQIRLLARREVAVEGKPVGLLARDLDGDRAQDLLVLTSAPGQLLALRGGPDGLTNMNRPLELGDDFVLGPEDLGDAGFAVALQERAEVLWFATGNPRQEPLRVALSGTPRVLDSGDIDGDGELELLLASADDTLEVIRSDGRHASVPLPAALSGRATFLHVTREGALAVGSQLGEAVIFLDVDHQAGPGGPLSLREIGRVELSGIPRAAAEADLDGDGVPELLVAGGDRSVWVLGSATLRGELTAPGAVPIDIEAVDLDSDGRKELVLIGFYDSAYGVLGAFNARGQPALAQQEYAGQDPVDGALGDFDGDGAIDLAVANRNARRVSLLAGTGFASPERTTFHQSLRVKTGANPTRVRSGNLSGTPLPEAVVLNAGSRSVLALSNQDGVLQTAGRLLQANSSARAIAVGDLDAAGSAQVLVIEQFDDGARLVGAAQELSAPGLIEVEVLADAGAKVIVALDRDGAVILIGPDGEPRSLAAAGSPRAAAQVELDGDERAELAVLTAEAILLLDDLSTWLEPVALALPGHRARDLVAADFDGDGREDIAVLLAGASDTAPGRVAIYRAQGQGRFKLAGNAPTGFAPAAIEAGDLNGDGRAELLCAAQNSHHVNLWTSGANGELLLPLADVGAGLGPLDVHLVDLDGDGRLDLVTANNFSHDLSVAYNLMRD